MKKPFEVEYEYYLEIRDELAKDHRGKLVAIKGREVLGIFDDFRQAANSVFVDHDRGTVLMQELGRDYEYFTGRYATSEVDDRRCRASLGPKMSDRQSMMPLESDFEYFLEIWPELVMEHRGKFVAIKNKEVLGIYKDYIEAAKSVYAEHEYGTVLMQNIGVSRDAFTIYAPASLVVSSK